MNLEEISIDPIQGFNPQEWLAQYDKAYPRFEWFIHKYVREMVPLLAKAREEKDTQQLLNYLNGIWFELPDRIFNIQNNPEGWREFLSLIEF